MFLKNIHLENVRCIEDCELSFVTGTKKNRKWTLLVGDNGTGKSTVLKSISLLMCGSEALLDILQYPDTWIKNGAKSCRISGVVTTAAGAERELALTIHRGSSFRQILKDNAESLKRLDDALEHTNRSYLTIGYGASRHSKMSGGSEESPFHHPRCEAVATLFVSHAQMIPFESWCVDLQLRHKKAGVKIIRDALDGLLPNVTFKSIDPDNRETIFDTPDGLVPLKYLSAGYQSVIGFVGDLLYRITSIFGDYKNPLATRGVLLIDELALHLHPVWQRLLIRFLTEKLPNFQIIATTNSPLIAHQASEGELHYLRRPSPKAPPALIQYEGSPNKLLLQQLIMSPVFGVETADSYEVEREKSAYRKLKSKSRMTAKDKTQLKRLKSNLAETSDWNEVLPGEKELRQLLNKIEKKLDSK